tara:strand:+ start:378 stop:551 length:174 start_codon:yes stop_codon:yes gene_type:complete
MIKSNGWDNHEDTFEETLRRELLAAQQIIYLLREDLKQMTEAYYSVLKDKEKKRNLN